LSKRQTATGPFKFKAWERGTQIVLERNADYWGQLATSGTAVFQWQAEAAARLIALKAGTADGIDNLAPTDIAASEADPALQVIPQTGAEHHVRGHELFDPGRSF